MCKAGKENNKDKIREIEDDELYVKYLSIRMQHELSEKRELYKFWKVFVISLAICVSIGFVCYFKPLANIIGLILNHNA